MSILKDAIDRLMEIGKRSNSIQPHPGDSHKSIIVAEDGVMQFLGHSVSPRQHKLLNMESLAFATGCYRSTDMAVWVSFQQVVVILDDSDYRDHRLTLTLTESPIFRSLQNAGDPKTPGKFDDPKKLYRFLKHELNGAAITPSDLDLLISNLKFRTEDELTRDINKGSDKMGQSIRSEVSGADKIPDLVSFEFLPWPGIEEDYQSQVEVPCQLYIDPAERTLSLKPLPGAIEAAKTKATTDLAKVIQVKWQHPDLPVFCGTP